MPTPQNRRRDVDACPGALRLHTAADGPLARVRLPGGLLTGRQLRTIRELAETWGDGHVELTSRANLQLRALKTAPAETLAVRLGAAGLLPSETHELVRNIAASPLSAPTARALVRDLDAALCADPGLAELPGRFLFAIDNGSRDVAPAADVAAVATQPPGNGATQPPAGAFAIVLAGVDTGLRVSASRVTEALLAAAHGFLDERAARGGQPAWRLRELDDGPASVAVRVAATLGLEFPQHPGLDQHLRHDPAGPGGSAGIEAPAPIGTLGNEDGTTAVGALVRLGRLDRVQMMVLEEADLLVVTPWRGVVVPDLAPEAAESWLRTLAGAGFEVAAGSPWSGVTACAGKPGCANALADVRQDAGAVVASDMDTPSAGRLPVHWVGCARGCGSPASTHVRVEATGSAYAVTRVGDLDDRNAGASPNPLEFSAAIPTSGAGQAVAARPSSDAVPGAEALSVSPAHASADAPAPRTAPSFHDAPTFPGAPSVVGEEPSAGRLDLERLGKLVSSARRG